MRSLSVYARELSRELLGTALPRRWTHVLEVARRATIIDAYRDEGVMIETAAWLHDVGYSPSIARTGFHPLDGARYLRDQAAPSRICDLVAFHSSAAAEAEVLGLMDEMREFKDERSTVRDLLWYLDMTTGPDGSLMTFDERMAEVRARYPADHYVIQALDLGMSERVAAVERARAWLESVGLAGHV